MRTARLKPAGADPHGTYYHLINRLAGLPGEFPFGEVERERFIWLMPSAGRAATGHQLVHA